MTISLIVAMSRNRCIGVNNKLPWHLPADLKRFKQLTLGHPMIMGRKTHESIGRLLPGRTSIIITRQKDYQVEGALVAHSLEQALELTKGQPGDGEIFIIGGGDVFKQSLGVANKIYLTHIEMDVAGDAFFPELGPEWHASDKHFYPATDETPGFLFETLSKV